MKEIFAVTGMTCAACQSAVQNAVSKLNGINDVNVNLLTNKMTVVYDEKIIDASLIISAVKNAGYGAIEYSNFQNSKTKDKDLIKLIISGAILIILMLISMGHMFNFYPSVVLYNSNIPYLFPLIQFILVIPVIIIYFKYYKNGFKNLIHFHPNMDSLIAVGSVASLAYGVYLTILIINGHSEYKDNLYIDSTAMILCFVSIGKYLEKLSKKKTTKAIEHLVDLKPDSVKVLINNEETIILLKDVTIGMNIIVKKGDVIPVDGIITKGNGSINEANITGEAIPVYKKENDSLTSGTILESGYLEFTATTTYEDSTINKIINLVDEAANSKAPISKLVDKIAGVFVPVIFGIAVITFIVNYLINKDLSISINNAVTVLVIACPCSLGLATPVAIMVASGKGAECGILIRNAEVLENLSKINKIMFDKTGTLTKGLPTVTSFEKLSYDCDVLAVAYSLEILSEHPLAGAICSYAKSKYCNIFDVENFTQIESCGIKGIIDGKEYYVGNTSYLDSISDEVKNKITNHLMLAEIPLIIAENDKVIGIIYLKDELKCSSKLTISKLNGENITSCLLSGDSNATSNLIAKMVGIKEVYAQLKPNEKLEIINKQKSNNIITAMVGDGVNDAPALATSDISFAVGSGSDVSINTADIVILKNEPIDVYNAIKLSKKTMNIIKGNLFWAFFYNLIAVLLATGALNSLGIKLTPMIASACMSVSSIFVVLNALRINTFKPININTCDKIEYKKTTLKVLGMMCEHCEHHVEEALEKSMNVISSKASYQKGIVEVEYQDELDLDELATLIKNAGYTLEKEANNGKEN